MARSSDMNYLVGEIEKTRFDHIEEEDDEFDDIDHSKPFTPSLRGSQEILYFDDHSHFILCDGNRAGGKTFGAGAKAVRHCVNVRDALVYLIVRDAAMLTDEGTMFYKLQKEVLPIFKKNAGVEFSAVKWDRSDNRPYIQIKNRFGGWSRIKGVSIPHPSLLGKAKTREPTMIIMDEGTEFPNVRSYFRLLIQQLGRRTVEGLEGKPQQFIILTNPGSKKNWIYQIFYVESGYEETGKMNDKRYRIIRFEHSQIKDLMPEGYFDNQVVEANAGDEVKTRQLVMGEWCDIRPGEGIYQPYIKPSTVVGKEGGNLLCPFSRYPITLGYDLGQKYSSISFMQEFPMKDGHIHWMVFDEVYIDRKYIGYEMLTDVIMSKMNWWCDILKTELFFEHISDNSAINQFRPGGEGGGSHDALDIERYSQRILDTGSYKWLKHPIVLQGATKFSDSISARTKEVRTLLQQGRIHVSSICVKHIQMFEELPCGKGKDGDIDPWKPYKPHPLGHVNDSMGYPIIEHNIHPNSVSTKKMSGNRFVDIQIG